VSVSKERLRQEKTRAEGACLIGLDGLPGADMWIKMVAAADVARRAQAEALAALGLASKECRYRIAGSARFWQLREYAGGGQGPAVLIVAAPIKKPYLWDLAPEQSAVRFFLGEGKRVYLLEWIASSTDNAGLDDYAGRSISAAVQSVLKAAGETKLFLMGHSLGGTLAAIHATLDARHLQGLVLLGAPLCFAPGTSRFRDGLVLIAPRLPADIDVVPGSLLSHISAVASPQTFIWSRLAASAFALSDRVAFETLARIERWTLDEVPLPGKLVADILHRLYRDNSFCREMLSIGDVVVGPSRLRCPTLAVVNTADDIAPLASIAPFLDAAPVRDARIIKYPGESGVGLQHLAVLAGRKARAQIWPEISAWLNEHSP
jgi:polyhydroxyalkanoate synthase